MKKQHRRRRKVEWKRLFRFFYNKIIYDKIDAYAAQTSFYIIMSAAPFLVLLLAFLKFTPLTEELLLDAVSSLLSPLAPDVLEGVNDLVSSVYHGSFTTVSFAMISLFWVAGRSVMGLMNGLNTIWQVTEKRNYVIRRMIASLYTVLLVFMIILACRVLLSGLSMQTLLLQTFPQLKPVSRFFPYSQLLIALLLMVIINMVFYTTLPNRRNYPLRQLPGSIFTTISWIVFTFFYTIYLNNAGNLSWLYGSLVTLVVTMLWLYFCMYLWFIGAEINAYRENPETFEMVDRYMQARKFS